MKQTGNYKLNKPEGTDVVNIEDLNQNMDILDTEVAKKLNKVSGKGLSTNDYSNTEKNKLAGIEAGATNYKHPATHSANMITETTNKQFVSSSEKTNWDSKSDPIKDELGTVYKLVIDKGQLFLEEV